MKSNHYMIPLMLPLYGGLFLLPYLGEKAEATEEQGFLNKPVVQKILWGVLILVVGSQFVINVINVLTSDWIGIADFIQNLR
jgi:hypothetical protein